MRRIEIFSLVPLVTVTRKQGNPALEEESHEAGGDFLPDWLPGCIGCGE